MRNSAMSVVFWDTNLFIYLIERHPEFFPVVEGIRRRMRARNDRLCTSTLTLGEVLAAPHAEGNESLAQRYRDILRSPNVEVLPFTIQCAEHYASIRTDRTIGRSDAIQLACAADAG
ncbi:MAG: PIN domain-containing protein, partial [Bryobacterales bacterium]